MENNEESFQAMTFRFPSRCLAKRQRLQQKISHQNNYTSQMPIAGMGFAFYQKEMKATLQISEKHRAFTRHQKTPYPLYFAKNRNAIQPRHPV